MADSRVAPDVLQAALVTYQLATALGPSNEALQQAISTALVTHERQVIEHAAQVAERLAEDLEFEEKFKDAEIGPAVALHWFAAKLRKDLPPLSQPVRYSPHDNDVVEVILTGRVRVHHVVTCANCHEPAGGAESWSIVDDVTRAEYHFLTEETGNLHVRVLTSHGEEH